MAFHGDFFFEGHSWPIKRTWPGQKRLRLKDRNNVEKNDFPGIDYGELFFPLEYVKYNFDSFFLFEI